MVEHAKHLWKRGSGIWFPCTAWLLVATSFWQWFAICRFEACWLQQLVTACLNACVNPTVLFLNVIFWICPEFLLTDIWHKKKLLNVSWIPTDRIGQKKKFLKWSWILSDKKGFVSWIPRDKIGQKHYGTICYCDSLLVWLLLMYHRFKPTSRPSPLLVLLHRHAVLSWFGLGKHSTLVCPTLR